MCCRRWGFSMSTVLSIAATTHIQAISFTISQTEMMYVTECGLSTSDPTVYGKYPYEYDPHEGIDCKHCARIAHAEWCDGLTATAIRERELKKKQA